MSFKSAELFKQISEGLQGMSEKEKKDIIKKVSVSFLLRFPFLLSLFDVK